jgi:putative membrane protein
MRQILTIQDRDRLNQQITDAEKRTKAQIIVAVIKRSDSYSELPWKAFAMGAAVAGLLTVVFELTVSYWTSHTMVILAVIFMLALGAVLALLTIFLPPFARFFLSPHRKEAEVRQYAEALFLSREIFATKKRTGILLLISFFERQVILLPDKGVSAFLTKEVMGNIISATTTCLAQNDLKQAIENGLNKLTEVLENKLQSGSDENELPDEIIEEKGV